MTGNLRLMCLRHHLSRFRRDTSGLAIIEFAMGFPVLLALGMYGIDTANLALTNLKLNQIALNLADNASRVGVNSTLSSQQMREVDVNDIFQGATTQGAAINLVANARVILSSLEKDSSGIQRIHWQRCFGSKTGTVYESHYGRALNTDGSTTAAANSGPTSAGMGDPGFTVNAPGNGTGVMFVEINYRYTPIFSWLSSPSDIRYVGSFIVRDPRDFSTMYNPSPAATKAYCGYTVRV